MARPAAEKVDTKVKTEDASKKSSEKIEDNTRKSNEKHLKTR